MVKIKLFLCGGEKPKSENPLGLGYLKSNCDADITIENSVDNLKDCDLIGLSSNAWGLKQSVDILNNSKIPVVIGGQGAIWEGLKKYDFKHIVIGEGEVSLSRIINGEDKKIICSDNIIDIDSLKFPDRGICGGTVPILTSRGCPWNCKFCSSQKYWGKVRYHSAEYFIDEVKYIIKHHKKAKRLYIMDDLFIANKKRFNQIYKLWMKNKMHKVLSPNGFVRSNSLTMEIALKMKDMGFRRVRFGAESGSDKVLRHLNKQATVKDNQNAIDICNKIKLPVFCSFMHDTPEESDEDRKMTKDFIKRNKGKMRVSGYYEYKSFPGTDLYDGANPIEEDMRTR